VPTARVAVAAGLAVPLTIGGPGRIGTVVPGVALTTAVLDATGRVAVARASGVPRVAVAEAPGVPRVAVARGVARTAAIGTLNGVGGGAPSAKPPTKGLPQPASRSTIRAGPINRRIAASAIMYGHIRA